MWLLFTQIPIGSVKSAFTSVNVALFALAGALMFVHQVLVAYSWYLILVAQKDSVSFWRVLQVHFIGNFFGVFMPTSVGMDVLRAYGLSRYLRRGVTAASSMFLSRVVGYLIFFALALAIALPVALQTDNGPLFWFVLTMAIGFVAGVWAILHPRALSLLGFLLRRIRLAGLVEKLREFQAGILAFRTRKGVLLRLAVWSLLYQVVGIYLHYLIGRSLGIDIALHYYFIYVPIIMAITLLPVSVGGLGTRELAFVAFFTPLGASNAEALSLSLLMFVLGLAIALVGGLLYWGSSQPEAVAREKQIETQSHEV